jgi:pimeloyl-ACP methyl ester carboxylesterase
LSGEKFSYTFDNIARAIDRFTEVIGFDRFAVYVFDYGAPTGFRLAARHPERITAIISQNGNTYEDGLSEGWRPIKAYWQDPSPANRRALRALLTPETTRWQYTHGVLDQAAISPDGYSLDNFYLTRPGADELQLDLSWILHARRRDLGSWASTRHADPSGLCRAHAIQPHGRA